MIIHTPKARAEARRARRRRGVLPPFEPGRRPDCPKIFIHLFTHLISLSSGIFIHSFIHLGFHRFIHHFQSLACFLAVLWSTRHQPATVWHGGVAIQGGELWHCDGGSIPKPRRKPALSGEGSEIAAAAAVGVRWEEIEGDRLGRAVDHDRGSGRSGRQQAVASDTGE